MQQPVSDFDSFGMMTAIVKEGDDFIQDVKGHDKQGKGFENAAPVFQSGTVVLVTR